MAAPTTPPTPAENPFHYVYSAGLARLLEGLHASLFVSTYQAGKLVLVRASQGRLSTLLRSFEQPMGIAVDAQRMALGTRNQLWFFRNAPDIAVKMDPVGVHDACYLPRTSHVTGDIRSHDIGWGSDGLWIVNTRFSCLCTLHSDFSFIPRWLPPFVTALSAEDRCHLNGVAMADGQPRYVTALGETDTADGWRANKANGGCVIDVPTGRIIARGLSMPHSPRMHAGNLWVLDSGTGGLAKVSSVGHVNRIAEVPGFTRGLTFAGRFAFVGLSRIRESSTFGGIPIAERRSELKCGVWVVDTTTGQTVEWLEFDQGVEEIFDVQIVPGVRFPTVVGFQKDTIHGTFVVPPEAIG